MKEATLDPIHQFQIIDLIHINIGSWNLSFTNVSLFMVITIVASAAFLLLTSSSRGLVPTRGQSVSEMAYEFVANTLRESAGTQGMRFFPLVFSLFMFVLIANFIGLFPYFYTVTTQIMITFGLAMLVILTVVFYGVFKHGFGFFKLFVPKGVPAIIVPIVTVIEVISFLSRPISLSVRLFANMLAGHITLKVFAGFCVGLAAMGPIGFGGAILPLVMNVAITALEFLVAFLQAYVFTVLTCMYLNDAVHPGH
ncbi:F0F1 ATP synthase subunit A [Bartonella sp. HY329]|uniref:F0F1 ATP synthase subunit A n=1 Tax=unclassified Bartonella TaxID=2645622 RepID=UPI0021C7F5C8|nr:MULTISPECIES: F0F1 ATP synthase subunit A [unclassified Bartonella]UXM96360.1 F0F1 ATP synthase subunit A [Bartonella sp. HY329]UXN10685.1 F0F1 ATP synthase subunit A [Bartonella sp. HY328]